MPEMLTDALHFILQWWFKI